MEAIMGHAPLKSWEAWWERGNDGRRTLIVTGKAQVETAPTLKEHAAEYPEPEVLYLRFSTLKYGTDDITVRFEKENPTFTRRFI